MHLVGSNSQVHCDKLQNRLSPDFSSRVLFYKEANCRAWSLTKPQLCLYFTKQDLPAPLRSKSCKRL